MVRDVLLVLFGAVWGIVVLVTVLRGGEVTAELWATLGLGVGGILAAFRTDDRIAGHKHQPPRNSPEEPRP